MNARILLVEDDPDMASFVCSAAEPYSISVVVETDGARGLAQAMNENFDCVILDVGLPSVNGLDICRQLRGARPTLPIVFLTARREEVDLVVGFELGADDYILKPFRPRELITRVRALIARYRRLAGSPPAEKLVGDDTQKHAAGGDSESGEIFRYGELEIDFGRFELKRAGKTVPLTNQEWMVLGLLLARPGLAIGREALMEEIWGEYQSDYEQLLNRLMWRVREKLGDLDEAVPEEKKHVVTVRGFGYRWNT